jgi:hypothetical protein
MLDLRRIAAPLRAARLALAAALTILCALLAVPAAHAANGELAAFGPVGFGPDEFTVGGYVAVDTSDGDSIYVADLADDSLHPRIRKYAADGTRQATVLPSNSNPSGSDAYVAGVAVDETLHRVYVLLAANGPDAANPGQPAAMEVLAYSTTPQAGALVPAPGVPGGVLIDFRTAGGFVDFPTGLAVDPETGKVAVVGIDDPTAANTLATLQYVTSAGALSTRVVGMGAALDGRGSPFGLAIGPDGGVYLEVAGGSVDSVKVYKVPRETGTPTLVATDGNQPVQQPGAHDSLGYGSPIGIAPDGGTVYVAEQGADGMGQVGGYSTATGERTVSYGGGTTSCFLRKEFAQLGIAGASGSKLVVTSPGFSPPDPSDRTVHVFGPGGTGCPQPQALFTVDGKGDGTVTVIKGQNVAFDASASQLQGGAPSRVDWDFDGSGAFATQVSGSPAAFTTTHKFLQTGTFQVGVKLHVQGGVVTDPVFHQVKVVAPTPSAAFKVSNRTPAAGAAVTFDASDSTDPAGSPTGGPSHTLAKYRWDFGDGLSQETTSATVSHAFANGGTAALTRTVKLVVVSGDGISSGTTQQTVTVAGVASGGGGTPPTQTPPVTTTPTQPPPPLVTAPSPGVTAASVDAKGILTLKVSCPAGGAACAGKIELTVKVKTKVKGKTKTKTVKLGTTTFSVAAGKSQSVKLKLSSAGRSLLRKQHKLTASAAVTVTAGGKASTKTKTLTLKAPAKKR